MRHLKQAEMFAFLASIFLVGFIFAQKRVQENPPLIILSEEEESYRFRLGSAKIPRPFLLALENQIVPLLDSLATTYGCDAIEVIGHTDESPIRSSGQDLDSQLASAFVAGRVADLKPGSNLDLEMMRSLSILHVLEQSKERGHLATVKYFFPYSSGAMIRPDRTLVRKFEGREDVSRRRIEIRLFRQITRQIR